MAVSDRFWQYSPPRPQTIKGIVLLNCGLGTAVINEIVFARGDKVLRPSRLSLTCRHLLSGTSTGSSFRGSTIWPLASVST